MVREPKHDSQRHIFDPNEFKIARMIIDMQVTQSPSRRIGHMIGKRGGNIGTFNRPVAHENLGLYLHRTERNRRQETDLVEHSTPIALPLRKRQTQTQVFEVRIAPNPRLKPTLPL